MTKSQLQSKYGVTIDTFKDPVWGDWTVTIWSDDKHYWKGSGCSVVTATISKLDWKQIEAWIISEELTEGEGDK